MEFDVGIGPGSIAVRSQRMVRWGHRIERFIQDDNGQDLIEYALVAALIGLGAVVSMKGLATKISSAFTTIGTNLTSAV